VRVPDADGPPRVHLAEFSTTVAGPDGLHDWLAAHRVTHVAMEATGVYWQPVWHILEDHFDLTLCNARHVKQAPGERPTCLTRSGSVSRWKPGCCVAAACRPSPSGSCGP
jgi:hypothetical protein